MAGFQFIHYEAYARTGNANKRSLLSIAQEADRDTGSHPHVTAPQPPEYLKGTSFIESAEAIIHAADNSKVSHGGKKRKIRKDANVGIGLIASHPTSNEDLSSMAESDRIKAIAEIKEWAEDVVKFAESEFKGLVRAAALHWDESHPHIHVLIGDIEPSDDFQIIHKGEQARKIAQGNDRSGLGKKLGNNAYTAEMRRFQDKYHEEVAIYYGHARFGPKRRRKSRSEWKKEQAQLDSIAESVQRGKSIDQLIEVELATAASQAQMMIEATQEEINRQKKLADDQKSLADDQLAEAKQLKEQADLDAREAVELKKDAIKLKSTLDDRIRQMSKYDGVLGKFLGLLGITQRIEKKAEDRLNGQLSKLRDKVDELSRQVGKEKSMQRQHRVTEDALKSLQRALSVTVEDYPHLKEKDVLKKHFECIQEIVELNRTDESLANQLDEYFARLDEEQRRLKVDSKKSLPEMRIMK